MVGFVIGLTAALGLAVGAGGAASAQTTCTDYLGDINLYLLCPVGPVLTVTPPTTAPGATVGVVATGWLPGSSVALVVDCPGPTSLGSISIGPDAQGHADGVIPATCPPGPHVISGLGFGMLRSPFVASVPVVLGCAVAGGTVPAGCPPSPPVPPVDHLVYTGAESARLASIGSALVIVGAAALYGSARARRHPDG